MRRQKKPSHIKRALDQRPKLWKETWIFSEKTLSEKDACFSFITHAANIKKWRIHLPKETQKQEKRPDKRSKYMESDIQKILKRELEKRECIYSSSYMLRITNMPFMKYGTFSFLNETYMKKDLDAFRRDLNVFELSLGVLEKDLVMFEKKPVYMKQDLNSLKIDSDILK